MKPLVSVITVVYNDSSHILQTMESVLSQTFKDMEYIVIDGGSNDDTVSLIQSKKEKLAYYISEKDAGIYDAMNKGIVQAQGEWVLFMNSGDSFYSETVLEDVFKDYKDNGESYICGNSCLIDEKRKTATIAEASFDGFKKYMPSFHQSIFARAYELKAHPFVLNYKMLSDFIFFYNLYQRNPISKYIPIVISNYDLGGFSSVNLKLRAKEFSRFFFLKRSRYFFFWFAVYIKKIIFNDK